MNLCIIHSYNIYTYIYVCIKTFIKRFPSVIHIFNMIPTFGICMNMYGASNICMNIDAALNICMHMYKASEICISIYRASIYA